MKNVEIKIRPKYIRLTEKALWNTSRVVFAVSTINNVFLKQVSCEMESWRTIQPPSVTNMNDLFTSSSLEYAADYFLGNCREMLLHTLHVFQKRCPRCVNLLQFLILFHRLYFTVRRLPFSTVTVSKTVSHVGIFAAWRDKNTSNNKTNSVVWVRERTIPTERPLLVGEVIAKFADRGCHVVSVTDPYGRILGFLDRSRYFSIK
jgi:hypothetical protein